jgi:hypothetical protein
MKAAPACVRDSESAGARLTSLDADGSEAGGEPVDCVPDPTRRGPAPTATTLAGTSAPITRGVRVDPPGTRVGCIS